MTPSASASSSAFISGADGKLALLTRSPDLRQAQHTSIIEDIRIWTDAAGPSPPQLEATCWKASAARASA
jgi:hypothetical protein